MGEISAPFVSLFKRCCHSPLATRHGKALRFAYGSPDSKDALVEYVADTRNRYKTRGSRPLDAAPRRIIIREIRQKASSGAFRGKLGQAESASEMKSAFL